MTFLNLAKLLVMAPLLLALSDCGRADAVLKPKPKRPSPYAFDLVLRMSPRAEAALKRPGSTLSVDAEYYGDAAPAYRAQADPINRIYLGEEHWTYSGNARRVHLHGEPIDTSKLPQTRDGQAQVIVSVTGSSAPDDLLSCHDYIGFIHSAQEQAPVLDCEFDTERYWDDVAAEPGKASRHD